MAHSNGLAERRYVSAGHAGKLLGVEPQTISHWESLGAIEAIRTTGGHRRFLLTDILTLKNGGTPKSKEKVILYCRCSTSNQRENLERQVERVQNYAKEMHSDKEILQFKEIGSGFSAERKELWKMLDLILSGELDGSVLICADRDRLSRFIVEIFEKICERHSIKVEYVEQDVNDDDKTFSADLIACITYWTVRYSSKKSGKRRAKPLTPECIERGLQLLTEGKPLNEVHTLLQKEGFTASIHTVRKYIWCKRQALASIVPPTINSAVEYRKQCTESGDENDRLFVDDLYGEYSKWCEGQGDACNHKADIHASIP